jgi:hypothetical protein
MKNWIVKSNEWYDNLPELKRFLFFFFGIMGSYTLVMLVLFPNCVWAFPIWAFFVVSWRLNYIIMKK